MGQAHLEDRAAERNDGRIIIHFVSWHANAHTPIHTSTHPHIHASTHSHIHASTAMVLIGGARIMIASMRVCSRRKIPH